MLRFVLKILLKYIHLYHKNFKCVDCSIRVYLKFCTLYNRVSQALPIMLALCLMLLATHYA